MALRNDISAGIKNDLINYDGALPDQAYIVAGHSVIGDSGARFYYYDPTSTATIDNENFLATTGMGDVGRYVKITPPDYVQSDWNQTNTLAVDFILNKPSLVVPKAYQGTTLRNNVFPIFKSTTVSSGIAVFHLTNDGTSSGTALFPTSAITESINCFVSDSNASFQMSYVFSNSNKTLTVTTNKLTTANILSGILGQAAGNGSIVNLQIWGY